MKTKHRPATSRQFGWYIPLILLAAAAIVPIVFALLYSFKPLQSIFGNSNLLTSGFTLENYRKIAQQLPILQITLNTVAVAVLVTVFKLLTSILAAYAFAFMRFRGKTVLYFVMISTIFIPFTVTMIPNYITISKLSLFDNIVGIALPQLADASGIFLLRQTMRSIPKSLLEIAEMDNIGRMRSLRDIILPICRPSIVATGIIFFINSWNEYVWPTLILRKKEHYTLSLAMQLFSSSEAGTEFTSIMAMAVISMLIPVVLYLIFQRYIMSTFASSGIKG
ncbi:carbohydrate ABC transporter permease [Oscillibacter valericigenes]|uniref:carbohydrate ABC transporter permease n=1 Tax=Oscillibacter ruminantium TaxID=1263547 RepID=UPI00058B03C4|nr:carbohydrate ABC transporter permease [Oscillibacter ruminantium]MDN0033870.1 carbohydrate ABC transporter permease [Oscillibacter valericigenes]